MVIIWLMIIMTIIFWLVVDLPPLKNDGVSSSVGIMNFPICLGHKIPWFQTTNQIIYHDLPRYYVLWACFCLNLIREKGEPSTLRFSVFPSSDKPEYSIPPLTGRPK